MPAYPVVTEKILAHRAAVGGILRRIVMAAGDAIMEHYDPSGFHGDVTLKGDNSPVTPADLAADAIIAAALAEHFPGIPLISEETVHLLDRAQLADTPHYWLVDPLDGTRAFRNGEEDFTVNIALIEHDTPMVGAIYAPALGEGFIGWTGNHAGALRWRDDMQQDYELAVRAVPAEGVVILTSQTGTLSPFAQNLMAQIKTRRHLKRSSSIKYCEIAAGRADVSVVTREIYYWDTAAGDAILRAAGGAMLALDGTPLRYDRTVPNLANVGLVACSDLEYFAPVIDELQDFIQKK